MSRRSIWSLQILKPIHRPAPFCPGMFRLPPPDAPVLESGVSPEFSLRHCPTSPTDIASPVAGPSWVRPQRPRSGAPVSIHDLRPLAAGFQVPPGRSFGPPRGHRVRAPVNVHSLPVRIVGLPVCPGSRFLAQTPRRAPTLAPLPLPRPGPTPCCPPRSLPVAWRPVAPPPAPALPRAGCLQCVRCRSVRAVLRCTGGRERVHTRDDADNTQT